jgi:hypothetical protein
MPRTPSCPPARSSKRNWTCRRRCRAVRSSLSLSQSPLGKSKGLPNSSAAPEIITTAPTMEIPPPQKRHGRLKLGTRLGRTGEAAKEDDEGESVVGISKKDRRRTLGHQTSTNGKSVMSFREPKRPKSANAPSESGPEDNTAASIDLEANPLPDISKAGRHSSDHRVLGHTSNTTQTLRSSKTFRFPRRRPKAPEPLFPISHLQQRSRPSITGDASASTSSLAPTTPESVRVSTSSRISGFGNSDTPTPTRPPTGREGPSPARALFSKSHASPASAFFRPSSRNSGQSSPTRAPLGLRGRSSTLSSMTRDSMDDRLAPPTARTSTSTGRKSFGDLLGLSRLRQNSDGLSGRHGTITPLTPGSITSKNNSLQLPRESIVLPERLDDDTPAKYLARLEGVVSRSVIASALSKSTDNFSQAVLRSYMRGFKFFGDPMDMAIRKLLMEAELPKETQQIDRCLQAFANRYHECNPGVYSSPDQAYFIAFSLLILHTDVFNKNNKHKMQKADYLKNTGGEGIFDEILEVFYDNISYTPFIHVEDDFDINGERIITHKSKKKKSLFPNGEQEVKKATKEPIDPYTLIIDNKLDILRPNLKDVMALEDHYSYLGTAKSLDLKELQKTFFKTGVLQIVSARSRPDAFMSEKTASNPEEAHPGIVDIKITKVGLLWRKDIKKKKTRSPWQEWGAILTGAQLYFFRNTTWVKNLMHQYETHIKHGNDGIPVIFKPPLEQFKPDALISTDGAVALLDSSYKKHKNAFTYVKHGGFEEVLLADSEEELNDWLAKLNYAAAFRTSGVRMRGVVGGNYEGQNRRAIRRLDSDSSQSVQTPTGEVMITRSKIDQKMAQDILAARREIMKQKVADADEKLQSEGRKLETQLRNAWHLQILAPIQPKTRDQMLLSAARMAAQLKWARVEIWRLKCHRDILLLDMEEERQLMGWEEDVTFDGVSPERKGLTREASKASTAIQRSPRSPVNLALQREAIVMSPEIESPTSEAYQTPPTSATIPAHHRYQNSWETPPSGQDHASLRKASVSSAVSSSGLSIMATPPRKIGTSSSGKSKAWQQDELDADERDLLQQAGLLEASPVRPGATKVPSAVIEDGDAAEATREHHKSSTPGDKADKNKIRRSLQRTLRESAGHLSHHRSRKGKEPGTATTADETGAEPDMLSRGSGSFVVHGKKASVITFGGDLQGMSPDERLRQRKSQQPAPTLSTVARGDEPTSPSSVEGLDVPAGDYHAVLRDGRERERRESAASASTATARSFRELHRKYSAARSANLAVPSDEDSDAAISFSEGRGTPLPPVESSDGEEGDEDDDQVERDVGVRGRWKGKGLEVDTALLSPPLSAATGAFFTPDPPASPNTEPSENGEDGVSNPPLQAVGA